jgi:hypothetical protein
MSSRSTAIGCRSPGFRVFSRSAASGQAVAERVRRQVHLDRIGRRAHQRSHAVDAGDVRLHLLRTLDRVQFVDADLLPADADHVALVRTKKNRLSRFFAGSDWPQ